MLQKWKKRLIRCLRVLLVLFAVFVLSRNWVARQAIQAVGSSFLDCPVTVGHVFIGFRVIQIDDIQIQLKHSTDASSAFLALADSGLAGSQPAESRRPNVRVGSLRVVPSIMTGIQDGIWVDQLSIEDPQLDLNFDPTGQLLTLFPTLPASESSSAGPIPVRQVTINRARLCIQQDAKSDLCLIADRIQANIAKDIDLTIRVSDLLGGSLDVHSIVDQKTLAGRTQVIARDLVLDSQQLSQLPLVPAEIHQEPFYATAAWEVGCTHPANQFDPRWHDLTAWFTLDNICCSALPEASDQMPLKVVCELRNQQGQANLSVHSSPLEGECHLTAESNLLADQPSVTSKYSWQHLRLELLTPVLSRKLATAIPHFTTQLDGSGDATVTLQPTGVQLKTSTTLNASDLSLTDISVGDFRSNFSTEIGLSLDDPTKPVGSVTAAYYWDGIDLGAVASKVGVTSTGRVYSHGSIVLPFAPLPNWQLIAAGMKVQWNDLAVNGLSISDSHFIAAADKGKATISVPETRLLDGEGHCLGKLGLTAGATMSGSNPVVVNFHASDFSLPAVARLAGINPEKVDGSVSLQGVAVSPWASVAEVASWDSDVSLSTTALRFQSETLKPIEVVATLRKGHVQVPEFQLDWRNTTCKMSAHGALQPVNLTGQISIPDAPLTDVAAAASQFSDSDLPLSGVAKVDGGFHFSLTPQDTRTWTLKAGGRAIANDLAFNNQNLGSATLDWTVNQQGLTVGSGSDDFFGGGYRIDARLADFDWTTTTIEGKVQDLQVARLLSMAGLNEASTGTISAGFHVAEIADLTKLQATGEVLTRGVSVFRIPVHLSEATVVTKQGQATVNTRGQISGGDFQFDAQTDLVDLQNHFALPSPALTLIPVFFQARLSNLTISSLAQNLRLPRDLAKLQGTIQGSCVRNQAAQQAGMLCKLEGAVERIQWNRMQLSERITGDLEVRPDRLSLTSVNGRIADGRLTGNADIFLDGRPRGVFQMELNRVNLRRAAILMGPAGKGVSGNASVGINGRLGNTISGNLDLNISHAVVSDLMVQQVSVPLDWSFSQTAKSLKWRCRNGVVETGNGKIFLATDGSFDRNVTGQLAARLERIDSGKLIRGKSFGAGIINGTVNVKAQRATDLKQVNGNFDVKLSQIQAMEMPVLDQLPSMIQLPSIGVNTTPQENGGAFQGRIASGVVYLDDAYVSQSNVHVLMNGRATLAGNLNLDVTASTQQTGPIDELIALADSPLMMAGPVPVAMLAKANEAMKNRVVHVQLTGTAARPILRLQPGKQLSQEALRFFIRSSLPTQFATVAENSTYSQRR